jgi:hypothetical protein
MLDAIYKRLKLVLCMEGIFIVLKNNINHILEPHLTTLAFWFRWFFDMVSEH